MSQASLEYPDVEPPAGAATSEVAPGVYWIRMPLPFALDHINLWLLEDGAGHTLVDTGIASDTIKSHWEAVLAARCGARPVRRLIVTHYHPDHFGLGAWLTQRLSVPVWMTHGEFLTAHAVSAQTPGYSVASMLEHFRAHGLDSARLDALGGRGNAYRHLVPDLPERFVRLVHGDEVVIDDRSWRVIVGRGHSPEHACLYCAELGMLIAGDMVLPRISTNVSVFAVEPSGDPLRLFLSTLRRLGELPADTLVLPSHGRPFRGLHQRIAQLEAHHAARCEELLAACDAPRSAAELLPVLFARSLDTHQSMFAMGEAIAHLNYLEHRRQLQRVAADDGIIRFVAPN